MKAHETVRRASHSGNGMEWRAHSPQDGSKPRQFSVSVYIFIGAACFAVIEAFSLLSPILLSVLLTFFISLALNPLVVKMRAFMGGRKVATACIALGVLVVFAGAVLAFLGPMRSSVSTLSEQLPEYWARLQRPLVKMEQRTEVSEAKVRAEIAAESTGTNAPAGQTNSAATNSTATTSQVAKGSSSNDKPESASAPGAVAKSGSTRQGADSSAAMQHASSPRGGLMQSLEGIAGRFAAFAFNAAQFMVVLITVFFGVTFTLMNPRPIFRAIFAMVPQQHHKKTVTILKRTGEFLPHWALATITAMVTVGLLVFFLMWPLLGLPSALILGAIAGIFEVIPYLGPLLSAVPAVMFALGKGGMTPVWVCLLYLAVQLLENNVIIPQIMSRGMKLHPVAVLFAILVCAVAFGVLGILVAAPLVAVLQVLHDEIYRKRFLPAVTDAELDREAGSVLGEKHAAAH